MKQDYSEIKNILANFLKINANKITKNTVIDKTVIQGSILIHRMYAELAEHGYNIDNYTNIRTYEQLINILYYDNSAKEENIFENSEIKKEQQVSNSIGIDIENVLNFKKVDDYREDAFYIKNFSNTEISHCIMQPSTIESFAGLFAAKEAIIKANNSLKNKSFNEIEIKHDSFGKPYYDNFAISISHSNNFAVAAAYFQVSNVNDNVENSQIQNKKMSKLCILVIICFIIISVIFVASIIFNL